MNIATLVEVQRIGVNIEKLYVIESKKETFDVILRYNFDSNDCALLRNNETMATYKNSLDDELDVSCNGDKKVIEDFFRSKFYIENLCDDEYFF
jgi:hypothetical protein